MSDRKWINPVTIEGAKFHFKDFSGNRYGKANRSIGIVLSPEMAEELANEGWNVRCLDATEEYPEAKYYIPVKMKYGVDRNGKYRHPDIYMIAGDKMTLLDEETVEQLDQAEIENCDLTFTPNFYEDKITAYLSTMYVTIRMDHLALKYAKFNNSGSDDETIPFE